MALISCSECGKEMSSTVKKCPHCGYVNKEMKQEKINKGTNFIKQHIKVISIIVIVILVVIIGLVIYNKKIEQDKIQAEIQANTLTDDEKMIASVVKKLQSSLKNPESLQVFEIIYHKSDDGSGTVIIDNSGQNGFGGLTRSRNMYNTKADGTITYWGSDSKANNKITNYTSINEQLEIAAANVVKEYWTKRENYIVADVEKIMRNLDQAN